MAAKKSTSSSTGTRSGNSASASRAGNSTSSPVSSTAVRNTSLPPRVSTSAMSQKRPAPTHDQIARKAYEIWKSGKGGSQEENWYRAERELRSAPTI